MRSALGRSISLRAPSNLLAVMAFVVATTWSVTHELRTTDAGIIDAGVHGVSFGLAVFLTWALARELDPDRPRTAALALVLVAPLAVYGEPRALPLLALLLATRLLVGTTGRRLSLLDPGAVAIAAGLSALNPVGLFAAGALADAPRFARKLDRRQPAGQTLAARWLGLGALVVAVTGANWFGDWDIAWVQPQPCQWAVVAGAVLIGVRAVARTAPPVASSDARPRGSAQRELLARERVRAARAATVAVAVLTSAVLGATALEQLPGAFAALGALVLSRGFARRVG